MKKLINSSQKTNAEYEKDYSCQACHINEAVLKLEGSGWMAKIQGNFCENCAIKKIKYWYLNDTQKSSDLSLTCAGCGRYKDKQIENNRLLRELEIPDLLNEIQRRMKSKE